MMTRRLLPTLTVLALVGGTASTALAHCQIPCGIYNDPLRFTMMEEEVTTIEKSMNQIEELSKEPHPNWNQIVRWVDNKEAHADALTEIVTFYFMAQRVKPADPNDAAASAKYVREITLLHQMMVEAMKAKQTTDLEHCQALRSLISRFRASYLGEQAQATEPPSHTHPAHTHPAQATTTVSHAHR
jgi:nickel superoxide dismutase